MKEHFFKRNKKTNLKLKIGIQNEDKEMPDIRP